MRRGRAQPCQLPACQIITTLCQQNTNAAIEKRIAKLNAQLILFSGSDLNTLTPSLKGSGRPWETIPLNNSPFLTALVLAMLPNVCFTLCLAMLFSGCNVLPAGQRVCSVPPNYLFEPKMVTIFNISSAQFLKAFIFSFFFCFSAPSGVPRGFIFFSRFSLREKVAPLFL